MPPSIMIDSQIWWLTLRSCVCVFISVFMIYGKLADVLATLAMMSYYRLDEENLLSIRAKMGRKYTQRTME